MDEVNADTASCGRRSGKKDEEGRGAWSSGSAVSSSLICVHVDAQTHRRTAKQSSTMMMGDILSSQLCTKFESDHR